MGALRSTIHCKSIEFAADAVIAADFSAEGNIGRHLSIYRGQALSITSITDNSSLILSTQF